MTPRSLHVVLVDDAPQEALLFTSALAELERPPRLTICASGPQALAVLQDGRDPPDLLLMDVHLLGESGIETLQRLKADAALRHVPVIMLSTSQAAEQVRACYGGYASAYVVKPSGFAELVELLARLNTFWSNSSVRLPRGS